MRIWFTSSDADLVARVIADERAAFEELVHRYQRQAHAMARSLGVRAGGVDDVVQEAFLRAFRELRSLRVPASFGAWFLNILKNTALEHCLKQEKSPPIRPGPDEPAPDRSVESDDFSEYLWRKVMDLPLGVREVVFLYYHEGESTWRVSKALGVSRSLVKKRLKQGRDLLRERLWREMEDCFRDMLPSVRSWKRRGRYLSLVAMLSIPPARALHAAAVAPAGASGLLAYFTWGAMIMGGKGLGVALAVLVVLLLGAIGLLADPFGWRNRPGPAVDGISAHPEARPARSTEKEAVGWRVPPDPAPARAIAPTGIAGTVFLERSGIPAAGARVAAVLEGERRHAAVAESGADGRYELSGLRPGRYGLLAWKGSWTSYDPSRAALEVRRGELTRGIDCVLVPGVTVAVQVVEEGTAKPIAGATVAFNRLQFALTDPEGRCRLEGIPASQIHLAASAPGFAIRLAQADVALGDEPLITMELPPGGLVEGRVITASGRAAAGATVRTSIPPPPGTNLGIGIDAVVDDDGRYRLAGLPLTLRNFQISASLGGLFPTSSEVSGFPENASQVELDLVLDAGIQLAGRVLDADERPLAGVDLYVDCGTWKVLATSGEKGEFRIVGVSGGMELLTARKLGYAPASRRLKGLAADQRDSLELVLEPGHTLSGTVVDGGGAPLARAWVYVGAVERHAGPYPSTYTDQDGRFRFDSLPARLKEIGALKSGYVDNRGNAVEPDRDDLRLALEEAGEIHGVVVDLASGRPVKPFTVLVDSSKKQRRAGGTRGVLGEDRLRFGSAGGQFAVRALSPGDFYDLTVVADGYLDAVVEGAEAGPISEPGKPIRIELRRGKSLSGSVVSAVDGKPLAGVRVEHRTPEGEKPPRTTVTGPQGTFTISGLADRAATLYLDKTGFARAAFPATAPGKEAPVFVLDPEAVLEGTVRTAAGDPLAEASLRVRLEEAEAPSAVTDALGRYRMGGLRAGPARVEMSRDEGLVAAQEAQLTAGKTTVVDFTEPGGAIAGRLSLRGGPVADAEIPYRRRDDASRNGRIRPDARGEFHIVGLPPGAYRLTVERPQHRGRAPGSAREVDVEVGSGERRIDIELPESGLSGRVVPHASGRPGSGLSVLLFRHGPAGHWDGLFRCDLDDWSMAGALQLVPGESDFRFDGLEPAKYVVVAATGKDKKLAGWLGPVHLGAGTIAEGLVLASGGPERLAVTVLDARTSAPVENATVSLLLVEMTGYARMELTDGSGRALFSDLPAGQYRLEVSSAATHLAWEEIRLAGAPAERTVLLEPASWIVASLRGASLSRKQHRFVATVVRGDDPGWRRRTVQGGLPAEFGPVQPLEGHEPGIRLRTRPGAYRIRFEIADAKAALEVAPLASQDLDVTVPRDGEAAVELVVP